MGQNPPQAVRITLHHREVPRFHFGVNTGTGDQGVDAYVTGGLNFGAAPTEPCGHLGDPLRPEPAPDRLDDAIGVAAGLPHPHGRGPATRTVTFHIWA